VAAIAVGCVVLAACATASVRGGASTIDFEDATGHRGTLDGNRGRVVILDVCASWATACNLNAKVLDEVMDVLQQEPVDVVTLLLDEGEMGRVALRSYVETLGVKHAVVLAGSRVRAGTSGLGDTGYVPRLVLLDKSGQIVLDDSGGVVNVEYVVKKVRALL
jgi:hypothetical protein